MSRTRIVILALIVLVGVAWASGCGDGATEPPPPEPPPPEPPRPAAVTVNPATARLTALGATVQLTTEVRDQNGQAMAGATVTWASGSAGVATVNASGLVTAVGNGTATITATAGGVSGSATVTVAQEVSAVTVSPVADTLVAGDTVRLSAEATDENGHAVAGAEFSWESGDTAVAVVDATGLVTGVGAGEVGVTATSAGVVGRAALVVATPVPTTVAVTPDAVTLTAIGQTAQLTAEVRDQLGRVMEGVAVAWSSEQPEIFTVNGAGVVTAVSNGSGTVQASLGSLSATGTVTVAQVASAIEAVSGDGQSGLAGDVLPEPVVVRVLDSGGAPVAEMTVTFEPGEGHGTASPATAVSDADGQAQATWMLGEPIGTQTLTASVAGGPSTTFTATALAPRVTLDSGAGSAPEGGVVTLGLTVDPVPESAIRVRYTLGTDGDPVTADADVSDYTDGGGGAVDIPAGVTGAVIEIAINDDDEIESVREVFTLTLDTPEGDAGYGLGVVATAAVTIEEGVCDRTPQVIDEILREVGAGNCAEVEDRHLARTGAMWLFVNGDESEQARITALREGDFAGLSSLENLHLRGNALAELPPGIFSGLSSLRHLHLANNKLTELPESVFAGLSSLESLRVGNGNPGAPFLLTLALERTDNPDPMAPGPAEVVVKLAEGAPFDISVELSAVGVTLSDNSAKLSAGGTTSGSVRIPVAADGSPLSVIVTSAPELPSTVCYDGARCYSGFMIARGNPLILANPGTVTLTAPASYLNQGVQNLNAGVPLIAGRQALLRVFATADQPNSFRPGARATFFLEDEEIYVADMESPAGIPLEVDESRLDRSFTATVPGPVLRPGVEMVVEIDPDGVVPLKPGSETRIPAAGRFHLDVREVPPLNLTVVPVHYLSETNKVTNSTVAAFTAAFIEDWATNGSDGWLRETREILPIDDLNVQFREPYFTQADTALGGYSYAYTLLDEIRMLRHLEADDTDEYYHGFFAVKFLTEAEEMEGYVAGVAYAPGQVGISSVTEHRQSKVGRFSLGVFIHELAHNLSLIHYEDDPDFPYRNGCIGVWGYKFGDDPGLGRLLDPWEHSDIMGNCDNRRSGSFATWISDYSFTKALDHRLSIASAPALVAQRGVQETLLLWGGVQEGELRLGPAFAHDARLKLPEASGPYQLEGLDTEGRRLFSLSFTPDELDHGGGSFLFAIPFEPEWTEDLDRVTLTGPEGSTTLDRDTGGRAALIIDRASGRVRTIARDWSVGDGPFPAAMAANAQVEVIRGLPSR